MAVLHSTKRDITCTHSRYNVAIECRYGGVQRSPPPRRVTFPRAKYLRRCQGRHFLPSLSSFSLQSDATRTLLLSHYFVVVVSGGIWCNFCSSREYCTTARRRDFFSLSAVHRERESSLLRAGLLFLDDKKVLLALFSGGVKG